MTQVFPLLSHPAASANRQGADGGNGDFAPVGPSLPATGRVLIALCDAVEAAQAVWLAGGVIEPRSMYLPSNFREAKPGLTKDERDKVDSVIWEAGFWSEASMSPSADPRLPDAAN